MPPGGTAAERYAVAQALRGAHLSQGTPNSPALANLALRGLDSRLQGLADAVGATYAGYADDLSFGGDAVLSRTAGSFILGVYRMVADEHPSENAGKTRVRARSAREQVTGIVVHDGLAAPRGEFDALKAVLHNCVALGPECQNRGRHPDFRAHLMGRIT